jgi:two-component system CheB/CheR fusion protein
MKLIAITGYGREDDIAHAREAGFDGHLVKPCDMQKLEEMINQVVLYGSAYLFTTIAS